MRPSVCQQILHFGWMWSLVSDVHKLPQHQELIGLLSRWKSEAAKLYNTERSESFFMTRGLGGVIKGAHKAVFT